MTYISYFRDACPPDPSQVRAHGPGLEPGNQVGVPATFTVENPQRAGRLVVWVKGPTSEAKVQVTDNKNGTYSVEYHPTEPGEYFVNVTLDDKHIPGSAFRVFVDAPVVVVEEPRVVIDHEAIQRAADEEAARRRAEEARQRADEEARRRAEEEEARRRAEEDRRRMEEEARQRAEEEQRRQEEEIRRHEETVRSEENIRRQEEEVRRTEEAVRAQEEHHHHASTAQHSHHHTLHHTQSAPTTQYPPNYGYQPDPYGGYGYPPQGYGYGGDWSSGYHHDHSGTRRTYLQDTTVIPPLVIITLARRARSPSPRPLLRRRRLPLPPQARRGWINVTWFTVGLLVVLDSGLDWLAAWCTKRPMPGFVAGALAGLAFDSFPSAKIRNLSACCSSASDRLSASAVCSLTSSAEVVLLSWLHSSCASLSSCCCSASILFDFCSSRCSFWCCSVMREGKILL